MRGLRIVLALLAIALLTGCKETIILPDGSNWVCDVTDYSYRITESFPEGYSIAICGDKGVYRWTPENPRWRKIVWTE